MSSPGTVRLRNAVFYAHHGVMQEEHRIGGRYEVDVEMQLDFKNAAVADDLQKTVDYEQVYSDIKQIITKNNFYLIERLSFLIAEKILLKAVMVECVTVTIRKSNPPVGGPCDSAEASFTMSRNAQEDADNQNGAKG